MNKNIYRAWERDCGFWLDGLYVSHNETVNEYFQDKDLDFVQYTGLDIRGKKVFEGDLILGGPQSDEIFGVIAFEEGCYCLSTEWGPFLLKHVLRQWACKNIGNLHEGITYVRKRIEHDSE